MRGAVLIVVAGAALAYNRVGIDGDNWLIEGRLADRYWVVEKYCPSRSDAFGVAGVRFLELAKMTREAAPELYE